MTRKLLFLVEKLPEFFFKTNLGDTGNIISKYYIVDVGALGCFGRVGVEPHDVVIL